MARGEKRAAHPVRGVATVAGTGLAVVVCCAALPIAASVGGVTVAAILGLGSLALALAAALGVLLVGRARRRRACARSSREGKS